MLGQTSFLNMLNAISSPGSEDGRGRSGSPDGPTTSRLGPDLVPANLSARQARDLGLMTSGTYGRTGCTSLQSAALQSSLGNKLAQKARSTGSILFRLTWKERDTPAGRRIFALRASALLISDRGFSFRLASWHTPSARDWKDSAGMSRERPDGRKRLDQLPRLALLASLRDCDDGEASSRRIDHSGAELTGLDAPMISGGLLDPSFSRWLMGYPPEWDACASMATQSCRSSRKPSSNPRSSQSSTLGTE